MGLASGSALVHPVSAFLGRTTITWDTSSCPAGVYTVTAVARGANESAYSVMTSNVSLPKGAIVQQFADLPAGTYHVAATATGNNDQSFHSQVQTVQGGNDGGVIIFGRSRPPTKTPTGLARSRGQPVDNPQPPNDARLTPAAAVAPAPSTNVLPPGANGMLDDDVRLLLIRLAEDAIGLGRQWQRIDVVDDDADGLVDYVAVEATSGEVRIYRLR
jgi:hypothetical protein